MQPGLVLEKNTYKGNEYQAGPFEFKRFQLLVGFLSGCHV